MTRSGARGFTLIEVLVAVAILGSAAFVLLQSHYASMQLLVDAQDLTLKDHLVQVAVGIAELEVYAGNRNGEGEFGDAFPDYMYSFAARESTSQVPGLLRVEVDVFGPAFQERFAFLVYDGIEERATIHAAAGARR